MVGPHPILELPSDSLSPTSPLLVPHGSRMVTFPRCPVGFSTHPPRQKLSGRVLCDPSFSLPDCPFFACVFPAGMMPSFFPASAFLIEGFGVVQLDVVTQKIRPSVGFPSPSFSFLSLTDWARAAVFSQSPEPSTVLGNQ